ncbi:MAG TPA: fumarylacetoacetate hydrolase family protein [Acidimicrobiia bacterium]|nr:fumarylacetoacetate hydrolase family protein [Acidimicrobiia bacterium]
MRLGRFSSAGEEGWGVIESDDVLRVAPSGLTILNAFERGLDTAALGAWTMVELDESTLSAPIVDPPQFVGVGINYRDHVDELGTKAPPSPVTFGLFGTAIVGPGDPIVIPDFSSTVDWEAELAIVIGKGGSDIPQRQALDFIAGYTIVNDVSARDIQMAEGQWGRAKSFDSFKPMGPWIVGTDELGDGSGLAIALSVNGVTKQKSSTSNLIFDVPYLVSHLSRQTTLRPGSVIATGTPGGIGMVRTPPEYLEDGDVVRIEIEGIGALINPVMSAATLAKPRSF